LTRRARASLSGELHIVELPVRVAHPYDLLAEGSDALSAFQRLVVRRGIRQRVKQVFRELYVVTPAEVAAGERSARFAGHTISPRMAGSILGGRGWEHSGDGRSLYKEHPAAGITAVFEFDTNGHFFGAAARTADIWFFSMAEAERGEVRRTSVGPGVRGEVLYLKDIPQPHFSEIMRDADLVVSVAQLEDSGEWLSSEGYERRAERSRRWPRSSRGWSREPSVGPGQCR